MKLRNKKTGEIVDFKIIADYDDCTSGWRLEKHDGSVLFYDHIDEIHEEWEDAPEEPKGSALDMMVLTLANFIENEPDEDKVDLEDCKQMLEKLKAWQRLKDEGFRFECYTRRSDWVGLSEVKALENLIDITVYFPSDKIEEMEADLDLLFGGEE